MYILSYAKYPLSLSPILLLLAVGIWKEKGDTPATNFLYAEVNARLEKIEGVAGAGGTVGGGEVGADGKKRRCSIM